MRVFVLYFVAVPAALAAMGAALTIATYAFAFAENLISWNFHLQFAIELTKQQMAHKDGPIQMAVLGAFSGYVLSLVGFAYGALTGNWWHE